MDGKEEAGHANEAGVGYLSDKAIDDLIWKDEEERKVPHAPSAPPAPSRPPIWRGDTPDPLHTLSNFPQDGLHGVRTEEQLVDEYAATKREQHARHIVAQHGMTTVGEDEVDEEIIEARKELLKVESKKRHEKELYADYRSRYGEEDYSEPFSFSNSKIPGPYLTLRTKGEFTRYEALQQRFRIHRKPRMDVPKASAVKPPEQESPVVKRRTKVEKEATECEEGDRLRRWKRKMGLI